MKGRRHFLKAFFGIGTAGAFGGLEALKHRVSDWLWLLKFRHGPTGESEVSTIEDSPLMWKKIPDDKRDGYVAFEGARRGGKTVALSKLPVEAEATDEVFDLYMDLGAWNL